MKYRYSHEPLKGAFFLPSTVLHIRRPSVLYHSHSTPDDTQIQTVCCQQKSEIEKGKSFISRTRIIVCMCVCSSVSVCVDTNKTVPVFLGRENNLMWTFWCCDTMWYLQWPGCGANRRWVKTEEIDEREPGTDRVVDTLYV